VCRREIVTSADGFCEAFGLPLPLLAPLRRRRRRLCRNIYASAFLLLLLLLLLL